MGCGPQAEEGEAGGGVGLGEKTCGGAEGGVFYTRVLEVRGHTEVCDVTVVDEEVW